MKFTKTSLADAVLIELEPRADERGFFARTFCTEEFAAAGARDRLPAGQPFAQPSRRARCAACTSSTRRTAR